MNILEISAGYGISKPISGGQSRFVNLITMLKKNGNQLFVLETNETMDLSDNKIAKIYTYNELKILNKSLILFRDFNPSFILKVYVILKNEKVDLIQITYPAGILIIKILIYLMHKQISIIYDAHNVESNYSLEVFRNDPRHSKLERFIIPYYSGLLEKIVCKYLVDHIISVSSDDKNTFLNKYSLSNKKITIIPSGCNISSFYSLNKKEIKLSMGIELDKIVIFFHGLYTHFPNKEGFDIIINYIAPAFEKVSKDVLFVIGGNKLPQFEKGNIKSLGFIENLHNVLSITDIAIVPLIHGAGTKLKIFDYMNAGLPIVSTKTGMEGIEVKNFESAIIVNDINEEFIDQIKYLITNKEERERIGSNARILVEEKYNWENICVKLDSLFKKIKTGCPCED